jgi:acetyl-CoA acyltransferase
LAHGAHIDGFYKGEVVANKASSEENGIKVDSTYNSAAKLKLAFVKPYRMHTAANSSFFINRASASLVMIEDKALNLGYKPLAYTCDWSFYGCNPSEELLLASQFCSKR